MKTKILLLTMLYLFGVNTSYAYQFNSEREGFQLLLEEMATLEKLINHIEKAPKMPGRYSVDYDSLRSDLRLMKRGLEDVVNNPISIDRKLELQKPMSGDYLK